MSKMLWKCEWKQMCILMGILKYFDNLYVVDCKKKLTKCILHLKLLQFLNAWECTCRHCWWQITCFESAHLLETLSNCRMHYIYLSNKRIVSFMRYAELRTCQRKQRQTLLKMCRKIVLPCIAKITMSVWRFMADLDRTPIPK